MDFKSQVYTTIEQSKRLIALGIKTETADCCHYYVAGVDDKDVPEDANCPAWSLHRLMEMLAFCLYEIYPRDNVYENIIYDIEETIKDGLFNKDYLEEEKK